MSDICSDFYENFNEKRETPEEKAKRYGVPLIPARRAPIPKNPLNDVTAICGGCGIELRGAMAYCCPRNDCPCGLGSKYTL